MSLGMTGSNRARVGLLGMLAVLLFAATAAASSALATQGRSEVSHKVQSKASPHSSQAMPSSMTILIYNQASVYGIAFEKGWWKQAFPHTKINFVQGSGASTTLAGLASGAIDMALLGNPPTAVGLAQGVNVIVPYIFEAINKDEALAVRSGITSPSQLRGKTIGVAPATTGEYALVAYLKDHGMRESDVHIVDGTIQEILADWKRGAIDGAYIGDPELTSMLSSGAHVLVDTGDLRASGWEVEDLLNVYRPFAEQYPAAVKAFIQLNNRCLMFLRAHPATGYRLMSKYMALPLNVVEGLMKGTTYLSAAQQKSPMWLGHGIAESIIKAGTVWKQLGQIKKVAPPAKVRAAVTTQYLQ